VSIAPIQFHYDVPAEPKALLVLLHGMAEHSARYAPVVDYLNTHGIGCCRFDLPGHGRSPVSEQQRGDVESFDEFVTAAVAAIDGARARYPDLPLFVWGHSMGAIVAALTIAQLATRGPMRIRGVITSSAPVAAFDAYPKIAVSALKWAARIAPTKRVARPFKPERLSRDLQVGERYGADPLVPRAITMRFLSELAQACLRTLRVARKLRLPWLALHGVDDEIAPAIGSQRLIDALGSTDKFLRLWPGARHEVHNEIEPARTEFLNCMVDWMRERA
jgi:acylglycerol lipase